MAPPKLGRPILCTTAAAAKPKQPLQLRGLALAPPRPLPGSEAIAIEEMVPGMLFGAKVSAVLPDGLRLSFAAYFSGTVGLEHLGVSLPGWAEEVDEKQRKKRQQLGQSSSGPAFVEGQKVTARLLWLEPSKKRFGFSLLPHQVRVREKRQA